MTTEATTAPVVPVSGRRHGTFHPLRVSQVEQLTDDAVAITFAVPDELRDDYAFTHGQHLTVRTEIGGEEVRRNYSICAPATERPAAHRRQAAGRRCLLRSCDQAASRSATSST